jgi:hypothetical protein
MGGVAESSIRAVGDQEPLVSEPVILSVHDGELAASESWVYVWLRPGTREVLYVGSTGLPPVARTWLHLHHEDPDVGRVRAQHPGALSGEVAVYAWGIRADLDRHEVRDALRGLLGHRGTQATSAAAMTAAEVIRDRLDARRA